MEEIRIECRLDFRKYIKLLYLLAFRKIYMVFITGIGILMFIFCIFYFLGFFPNEQHVPYAQIFLAVMFGFVIPSTIYISGKKNYRSSPFRQKLTYVFTEDKLNIIGETFNTEMNWNNFYKVIELKNWILIYSNKNTAFPISKESFNEPKLKSFRNFLALLPEVKMQS